MKRFLILLIAVLAMTFTSCSKETDAPSVLGTYWEGSVAVQQTTPTSVLDVTYTLQMMFKTETQAVYQYALGIIPGYYTSEYTESGNTVTCIVSTTTGETYTETGTLSSDGNTMTYHTKIFTDDDTSWTDIVMTKKPVPNN